METISASVQPTSASRVTAVPRRSLNVTPSTLAFLTALPHDALKPSGVHGVPSVVAAYLDVKARHEGSAPAEQAQRLANVASLDAAIDRQAAIVADLDSQVAALDKMAGDAVAGAAKRGRVAGAQTLMDAQAKARGALADKRPAAVEEMAGLRSQKAKTEAAISVGNIDPGLFRDGPAAMGVHLTDEQAERFWIVFSTIAFGPIAAAFNSVLSGRRRRPA